MRADMSKDVFADTPIGRLALQKLAPVPPNFRLYKAAWMGRATERMVMKLTGAEFRVAKSGPNKGVLSVIVKGTQRVTCCTADELREAK